MKKLTIAALGALVLALAACGGGGGSEGAPAGVATSGTLSVSVRADGDAAIPEADGSYALGDPAALALACNVACTVTEERNVGVTLSARSSSSTAWAATLDFAALDSLLDLKVAAADGSAVSLRMRRRAPAATGTATWSLDAQSWSRSSSTQSTLGGASGPATTGITVSSTSASSCRSGPWACGTVSVHWYGTLPGTFTIDPNFLVSPQPGKAWINAKATGGTADDTIPNCTPLVPVPNEHYYNTDYRPATGTIRVTQDANGSFHVTTDTPLTALKQPDSENVSLCLRSVAAPTAPASMSLILNGVY